MVVNDPLQKFHKFHGHNISPETKILIVGTFHPKTENGVDFFYGRPRNFLWRILPACYNSPDLKNASLQEKKIFMATHNIDFVDVIRSVKEIPNNFTDETLDCVVDKWNDEKIKQKIEELSKIEAVYFTRKTFGRIPNIEKKVSELRNFCSQKCIRFCYLETPARFSNIKKVDNWKDTIIKKKTCI